MAWIIWNTTQRKWVGHPGLKSSYTNRRELARSFPTREAAEADCCGDERVVNA